MLEKYECKKVDDYINALTEIIQQIALLGLYRADFFSKAAFYGGTSLRIFYGLDRFSEHLDFSLLENNQAFDLDHYCRYIEDELGAYGFDIDVEQKNKTYKSNIESSFIKGNTMTNILAVESKIPDIAKLHKRQKPKIKFEIDIAPPGNAGYEIKYLLTPIPFHVKVFDLPSLFAGKVHAVLFRGWKSRIKGRDLYDYVWYLSRNAKVNIRHLNERIRHSDDRYEKPLDIKDIKALLKNRFEEIDYRDAVNDVLPFIKDDTQLKLWSKDFFVSITEDMLQSDSSHHAAVHSL